MKALARYAAATALVILIVFGATSPFLDGTGRASLLVAAAVAVPVQWASFLFVLGAGKDHTQFLLRWGIGVLLRLGIVVAVGLLVLPRLERVDGAVLILGLCGFFFTLQLLEPVFIRRANNTPRLAQ